MKRENIIGKKAKKREIIKYQSEAIMELKERCKDLEVAILKSSYTSRNFYDQLKVNISSLESKIDTIINQNESIKLIITSDIASRDEEYIKHCKELG